METALSTLAQVFVGPLVGTISDHYGPAILEKIGIKWDVTKEMKKLSVILLTIKVVLEDAEEKQVTNELIGHWLRELKNTAYDVEDLLDECATEEALHEPESTRIINGAARVDRFKRFFKRSMIKRIKRLIKFEEIAEQRPMNKRIKRVINKFEEIAEQRSKFNLFNLSSTTRVVNYRVDPRRETSSFPTELKVYGRDEEKDLIVNLMVNNINAGNLSIYAIVGIGGLGKTTLAQMVYHDNMVTSRFEIKLWVCVSEKFEVKSLIGDIIQFRTNDVQTLDELQCRLQEKLSGKRFLLILDDVWNEDEAKWERLKSSLSCGAKGSSIIVTTRSDKVASLMAGSSHDHVCHPKMLSEEDCFSLFKHRAFAEGEGEHHPNLESIGKEIVKKYGGVPLAAKALGGLLRFHREEKEWLFVKESKLWDLPQDKEDSILPALWLSYKHLPQHLRQCFAYCSIFPKDYIMKKEVLIQLWMANGFLQPKVNMELEHIGNGVFNDLLWRGFFQEVTFDSFDNTEASCNMHDLVHDLACSITRNECFSVVTDADKELVVDRCNTTRHLGVYSDIVFSPNFILSINKSLRTLLQLGKGLCSTDVPPSLNFSNLIYLRVLDLSGSRGLKTLPESIARLKLLRYLDLSETSIALLSDEVFGNLINLQTLKLRECDNLEMLPGNISKLTNLRLLDITKSTGKLLGMPVGMGQLKSLHKLSHFIVSEDCGVEELQELNHLRGTLEITCLWKVKEVRDAENAKLSRKEISVLVLNWSTATAPVPSESQTNSMNDKLTADALQPPPNIVSLDMDNYGGCDFPRWMNSTCLFSLVELSLRNCSKCKHLPTLGLLPHLKKLFLERISTVECIGNEFYCDEEEGYHMMMKTRGMVLFPALEELELKKMPSLKEWKGWSSSSPLPSSVFPLLKRFTFLNCPKLTTIPLYSLTSLESLDISGCGELELLPDDFQNLVSLKHLRLSGLPKLAAVPVIESTNQRLLHTLYLINCKNLKSLPEGIQHITALRHLMIADCHPELHRRCEKNTGEDWHKIAHIPKQDRHIFVWNGQLAQDFISWLFSFN